MMMPAKRCMRGVLLFFSSSIDFQWATLIARLVYLIAMICGVVRPVSAQVLQFPSWNVTTLNTTVIIPNGGNVLLGGMTRSRTESSVIAPRLGSFHRSLSRSTDSSSVRMYLHAHDFESMERALGVQGNRSDVVQQHSPETASAVPKELSFARQITLLRASASSPQEAKQFAALAYLDRARISFDQHNSQLSRLWIRAAMRDGDQEVQQQAGELLARVEAHADREQEK